MKNFKIINLGNLIEIQQEVYKIISQDNKIPSNTHLYYLDNHNLVDLDRFKYIPSLSNEIKKLGWFDYWKNTAIVITYQDGLILHQDSGESEYSLLIPIKNTKNTWTVFYNVDTDAVPMQLPNSSVTYLGYSESSTVWEIERVESVCPVLLNIKTPHKVIVDSDVLPRITISLRMSNKFNSEILVENKRL